MADEATQTNDATVTETQPDKSAEKMTDAKFSQADLDRVAGERGQKAAEAARKKLLTELGIEDVDADKVLLAAARKRKADDQTEVEKAAAEAAKAQKRADDLQAELDAERSARRTEARDRKLIATATTFKAQVPEDVLAWAAINAADALAKTLNADGTVNENAVEALVKACQTARPTWFGARGAGSPSLSGGHLPDANKDRQKRVGQQSQRTIRG